MKGLFLCAYKQRHYNYDIDYNDVIDLPGINILGDCLNVDLNNYDYLLASPPCNFYSRANYHRYESSYSLRTKKILPILLVKFALSGKPFLIENVRNDTLFKKYYIYYICDRFGINIYTVGRHTYFTNMFVNLYCEQVFDNITFISQDNRQGGSNTYNVFEIFLYYLKECKL